MSIALRDRILKYDSECDDWVSRFYVFKKSVIRTCFAIAERPPDLQYTTMGLSKSLPVSALIWAIDRVKISNIHHLKKRQYCHNQQSSARQRDLVKSCRNLIMRKQDGCWRGTRLKFQRRTTVDQNTIFVMNHFLRKYGVEIPNLSLSVNRERSRWHSGTHNGRN